MKPKRSRIVLFILTHLDYTRKLIPDFINGDPSVLNEIRVTLINKKRNWQEVLRSSLPDLFHVRPQKWTDEIDKRTQRGERLRKIPHVTDVHSHFLSRRSLP